MRLAEAERAAQAIRQQFHGPATAAEQVLDSYHAGMVVPAAGVVRLDGYREDWGVGVELIAAGQMTVDETPGQILGTIELWRRRITAAAGTGPAAVDWLGTVGAFCRPVQVAAQLGVRVNRGAMCCVTRHPQRGKEVLTCNHVAAGCDQRAVGDPVTVTECGGPGHTGSLADSCPITGAGATGYDAALVALPVGTDPSAVFAGIGVGVTGMLDPLAVTGAVDVCGPVTSAQGTLGTRRLGPVPVSMAHVGGPAAVVLWDVSVVRVGPRIPFSAPGDSGSLVTTGTDAIGMVVAGGSSAGPSGPGTLIAPLPATLGLLGVSLVP